MLDCFLSCTESQSSSFFFLSKGISSTCKTFIGDVLKAPVYNLILSICMLLIFSSVPGVGVLYNWHPSLYLICILHYCTSLFFSETILMMFSAFFLLWPMSCQYVYPSLICCSMPFPGTGCFLCML